MTLEGTSYAYWPDQVSLDALRDGPLLLTGGDYAFPGPNGLIWVLRAGRGNLELDTTYEGQEPGE